MREIKFRAEVCGKLENVSAVYYDENDKVWRVCTGDIDCWDDWKLSSLVHQYTGLKDKNGKEIYEGDILGGEYYVDAVAGEVTIREDWGGCSFLEYKGGGDDFLFRECKHAEVIGNIYENPELLSKQI